MSQADSPAVAGPLLAQPVNEDYARSLSEQGAGAFNTALFGGLIAVLLAFSMSFASPDGLKHFMLSYITSYGFLLSLTLGCLFFVLILHLTKGGWGVLTRRLAEIGAANLPVMGILFIPILVTVWSGSGQVYSWAIPASEVEPGSILAWKTPFLNNWFFTIRWVLYFAIWGLLSWYFYSRSLLQDRTADDQASIWMEGMSAPGMILFALTASFAAIDLFMSLDYHWFSTIYGVWFFAGSAISVLCFLIISINVLQRSGRLTEDITAEHYHDLGKLLFGFIVFWSYIAFSQYMLIWYGNIPEETGWYQARQENGWWIVGVVLIFGHFVIPFLGIISRSVKRQKNLLMGWAVYMLVMHWIDLYYQVFPSWSESGGPPFLPLDPLLLFGLGCFWIAGWIRTAGDNPLVAVHDPRLEMSRTFENM